MSTQHDPGPAAAGSRTRALLAAILARWPQHKAYLQRAFAGRDAGDCEEIDQLSGEILALAGRDLDRFADDYRWMCGLFLKHELAYRRSGSVAHADTAAIRAAYYDNDEAMGRYMRGLLVSQVVWPQHLGVHLAFRRDFLPRLADRYAYMEVGPGHGVTLAVAGADPRCGRLAGCDISATSLAMTRESLATLGVTRAVDLIQADICAQAPGGDRFDGILISQVLELVSSPQAAMAHLAARLCPGGRIFVNCPVRMLAPDHLRIWADGAEVEDLVRGAGLTLEVSRRIAADPSGNEDAGGYSQVIIASAPTTGAS